MGANWRLPLRLRLVASIGLTVLIAITAFGVIGYRAVTVATRNAALTRLQSVVTQVAQQSSTSTKERLANFRRAAADSAVIEALRNRDSARVRAAIRVLTRLGPDTGLVVGTELRAPDGSVVARVSRPAPGGRNLRTDSAMTTPLFVAEDSILFGWSAPVVGGGQLLGHIYQARRIGGGASVRKQVAILAGPDASFIVGNVDGSLWVDLGQPSKGPFVRPAGSEYTRGGVRVLAASAPVPGSSLVFDLELPTTVALAAATSLLRTFFVIGGLVLVMGIAVAWIVARTITSPLATLTRASGQIASGPSSEVALPVGRYDEIGSLARSFATMADRVREGREKLESQVAERTKELSDAVEQLKETQEELVRKERLATLGQLSSGVGHELRNPLGVMTNAIYYLEATQREAPPKVREYLGIIKSQIRISEKIVADLLDFARIRPPQRTEVRLAQFIDDQIARATLPQSITVQRDLDGVPSVFVDPIQMGQVLFNLFTNASQAMENGPGTLTVRARPDDGRIRLEIADSGPGIPEAIRQKIFEPLFTTKARGIGLGLAVSRGLARANGGDLSVRSDPGHGATFVLDLPAT